MSEFENMSGPELVQTYNRMAMSRGLRTVARFADTAVGRRRCEALASQINGTPGPIVQHDIREEPSKVDIFAVFKTHIGKFRGKLLNELYKKRGTQVALIKLIMAVYGSCNNGRRGALLMVMKGLEGSIKKKRLPYRIEKQKTDAGVISYGLYDKT